MKTLLLALVLIASPAMACPMCKDGAVVDVKAATVETASFNLNPSIYAMLGLLGTAATFAGRAMVRAVRESNLE